MHLLLDVCSVTQACWQDGTLVVKWAPGHSVEADTHYGKTGEAWCMTVDPEGNTEYLVKTNTLVMVDGEVVVGSRQHQPDPYWQQTVRSRMLARVFQMVDADKNEFLTRCVLVYRI